MFIKEFSELKVNYNCNFIKFFKEISNNLNNSGVNVIIFGSTIHKLLTNSKYICNDIDIIFNNEYDIKKFIDHINLYTNKKSYYKPLNKSKLVSYSSKTTLDSLIKYHYEIYYDNNLIHGMILNMDNFTDDENLVFSKLNKESIELLSNKIKTFDFLSNFYINDIIYSKLDDLMNVKLTNFKLTSSDYVIIKKYINRNVKFTLDDNYYKMFRPTNLIFSNQKLYYKSKDLVVLPLNRNDINMAGKSPMIKNWNNLTTNYDFVMTEYVNNIGLLCGPTSGIICIDVDVKDNGVNIFNKLLLNYNIPNCPIQKSANGGFHYIFKYNNDRMKDMNTKIKCALINDDKIGIDMLIKDSQFVVYPSINYTNGIQYTWIKPITDKSDIPEMPEWLYELYEYGIIDDNYKIIKSDKNLIKDNDITTIDINDKSIITDNNITNISDKAIIIMIILLFGLIGMIGIITLLLIDMNVIKI